MSFMTTWNFTHGWSLRIARVNRVMVAGMVMITTTQPIQAEQVNQPETPSIEFIEFLGGGVTVNDEFLDPMNYSEIDTENEPHSTKQVTNDKILQDEE